jgi:inner membrane protein YidH
MTPIGCCLPSGHVAGWVWQGGRVDVDPRFTLANERTFLAWIRTALGMLAGAAALDAIDTGWPESAVRVLAAVLAVAALMSIVIAWWRWRRVQLAIESGVAAPVGGSHLVPAAGVLIVGLGVLVLVLT